MQLENQVTTGSKIMYWVGWIFGVLPALLLIMSAVMKLAKAEIAIKGFPALGWDERLALDLGIVELACAILYLLPPTAVLGAILLTGYLGGAVATHVRIFEPYHTPIILGVMLWLGLFLRDARLRALVPFRK